MRTCCLLLAALASAAAQPLPGTRPLTLEGDPARKMIDGIGAWLERATEASAATRHPSRERLRTIIGAVDPRVAFDAPELLATTASPARLAETRWYSVYAVRWPVLDGLSAEGLLFEPARGPVARVVVLPDADQDPEDSPAARRLAAAGCQVLVMTLLDRRSTYAGTPGLRMTNQSHREFIYRMAFEVGRHVIGYELEKALAAVDWFARQKPAAPIGIWGEKEGGLLALDAAALDPRIAAAVVSGYFQPREGLWKEPLYHNVWSLLRDFGDAEIARLVAPRALIIEPGAIPADAVRREFERARTPGDHLELSADATPAFLRALGIAGAPPAELPPLARHPDREGRMRRQVQEMIDYTQKLVRASEFERASDWDAPADLASLDAWRAAARRHRARIWDDMIGRLPQPALPPDPRTRLSYRDTKWDGYEVTLDVYPDVFAYGVLLLPKNIRPGERRPVVVVQHGLDGRAQSLFGQAQGSTDFHYYQNLGSRLADLGYVVYSPQNPYIGEFRHLQRQANPLGLSIFSFILAQNERLLDWLDSLPFVDPARIGFYGLSYGGKTALRVPPLLERYALSICSGDFNEWVRKVTTVDRAYSYLFTQEYEMPEWDLAHGANHAELARLMAPRPFMVERGHRDAVGADEWVAYEYAKVRRFYDEMGIGDRTRLEFFNGPHMIHAVGTLDFLNRFLGPL